MTDINQLLTDVEKLFSDDEVVTEAKLQKVTLPSGKVLGLVTLDNGLDHTRPNTFGPKGLVSLNTAYDAAQIAVADQLAQISRGCRHLCRGERAVDRQLTPRRQQWVAVPQESRAQTHGLERCPGAPISARRIHRLGKRRLDAARPPENCRLDATRKSTTAASAHQSGEELPPRRRQEDRK